jgi:hypothetical protein
MKALKAFAPVSEDQVRDSKVRIWSTIKEMYN